MAAHVYTALTQLIDDMVATNYVNWPGMQAALDLSTWTEQLDIDEYLELQKIVTAKSIPNLAFFIGSIMLKYKTEWEELDKPTTREEWLDRWLVKHIERNTS